MKTKLVTTFTLLTISSGAFAASLLGGTSGGGGNIPLDQQVNVDKLTFAIETSSRKMVKLWLNTYYARVMNSREGDHCNTGDEVCAATSKLIKAKPSIYEIIDTVKFDIKYDDYCYDNEGNKRDGSIYGATPNHICISIHSLSSKVSKLDYIDQISGLVLHEISHLYGSSEELAQKLQANLLDKTPNAFYHSQGSNSQDMIRSNIDKIEMLKHYLYTNNFGGKCNVVQSVRDDLFVLGDYLEGDTNSNILSFMSPKMSSLFWAAAVKMSFVQKYVCARDNQVDKYFKNMDYLQYESIFLNGAKQRSVDAVYYNTQLKVDRNIMINKIEDQFGIYSELEEIKNLLQRSSELMFN